MSDCCIMVIVLCYLGLRLPRRIPWYSWGDRGLVSLSRHAGADCWFPPGRCDSLSRHSPSRGSVGAIRRPLCGRLPDLSKPKKAEC